MIKLKIKNDDSNIVRFTVSEFLKNEKALEAYLALQNELDEAEQEYRKKFHLKSNARSREFIIKNLQEDGLAVYMGKIGDKYVSAAAVLKPWNKVYSVMSVVVSKSYRGKGFGKQLMSCIVNDYSSKTLHLSVSAVNPAGIELYSSVGFSTVAHSMYRVPH